MHVFRAHQKASMLKNRSTPPSACAPYISFWRRMRQHKQTRVCKAAWVAHGFLLCTARLFKMCVHCAQNVFFATRKLCGTRPFSVVYIQFWFLGRYMANNDMNRNAAIIFKWANFLEITQDPRRQAQAILVDTNSMQTCSIEATGDWLNGMTGIH